MSLRNKKIIIPLLVLVILFSGAQSYAFHFDEPHGDEDEGSQVQPNQQPPGEKTITPSAPAPSAAGSGDAKDFLSYARFLYPFMLSVAAILAVFMIVFAGIQMMAAVGNPGMIESAKKRIWAAIGGLLLAVGSFLILRTINPDLIKLQLNVPGVTITGQTTGPGGGSGGGTGTSGQNPTPTAKKNFCVVEGPGNAKEEVEQKTCNDNTCFVSLGARTRGVTKAYCIQK
ncbi:MAG: pilin [bacterium]|nr:pilin [bacterium]